jgi:tripartite-type tricarboxylate transporter receptor subunit TctC
LRLRRRRRRSSQTLAGEDIKEDIKEKVRRIGLQPARTTPDELGRVQRDDIARWASAVKASGFKPEQ